MEIQLIKSFYKCTNIALSNGDTVTINEVTIQDGKVITIMGALVNFGTEQSWNFSATKNGDTFKCNSNNVPLDIESSDVIKEIISIIETNL